MRWLLLLAFLASPLEAQVYARLLFRNGTALVFRDSTGPVQVRIQHGTDPSRGVLHRLTVYEGYAVGLAGRSALPDSAVEFVVRGSGVVATYRCQKVKGCWVTISNPPKGGYFLPAPNVPPFVVPLLGTALIAAVDKQFTGTAEFDLR